jgi:hypothetical protein
MAHGDRAAVIIVAVGIAVQVGVQPVTTFLVCVFGAGVGLAAVGVVAVDELVSVVVHVVGAKLVGVFLAVAAAPGIAAVAQPVQVVVHPVAAQGGGVFSEAPAGNPALVVVRRQGASG